jgi:hypothetical protein
MRVRLASIVAERLQRGCREGGLLGAGRRIPKGKEEGKEEASKMYELGKVLMAP